VKTLETFFFRFALEELTQTGNVLFSCHSMRNQGKPNTSKVVNF
jgi:hypothetical protein